MRLEIFLNPDHEDFDEFYASPVYEKEALCSALRNKFMSGTIKAVGIFSTYHVAKKLLM